MDHRIETVRVLKGASRHLLTRVSMKLSILLLTWVGSLLHEIWCFEDLGSLEDASLNSVRREVDLESPLFDFL